MELALFICSLFAMRLLAAFFCLAENFPDELVGLQYPELITFECYYSRYRHHLSPMLLRSEHLSRSKTR